MHLGVVVAFLAQDVGYTSHRILRESRPTFEIDHHLVAIVGLAQQLVGDIDVLVERTVVGSDKGIFGRLLEHAHIAMLDALNDLDDTSLWPTDARTMSQDLLDANLIAREGLHIVAIIHDEWNVIAFDAHYVHTVVTTLEHTYQFGLRLTIGQAITTRTDLTKEALMLKFDEQVIDIRAIATAKDAQFLRYL